MDLSVRHNKIVWDDPIYGYTFEYFLGWTPRAFEAYYLKRFKKPLSFKGYGITIHDKKTRTCLMFVARDQNIATLAHEVVHSAIYVFDSINIPIDINHDEAFAYYVQAILEKAII